ncbi:MAG: sugar phosphate nucleotidyltransferase [Bacteroidota bacterium]
MHLLIPMAGKGKRMRPHTLTTPKPLIPIAGKPIVERLIQAVSVACPVPITTIGFVVSELNAATRTQLVAMAQRVGAEAKFYGQSDALGTAHAVYCAQELLSGPVMIAFADTLFRGDFVLDMDQESIVWVKTVTDPAAFGVVKTNDQGQVTDFVEKPTEFVSNLAIIGIYYFQDGTRLKQALQTLVDEGVRKDGEYQLTTALEQLSQQGMQFATQEVQAWLDCGTKAAMLHTNRQFLDLLQEEEVLIAPTAHLHNSVLIPPVYLGEQVVVQNAVLGPHVSVGNHSRIDNARIQNSIIQSHSNLYNTNLDSSMIGNYVQLRGRSAVVSIGDYNTLES